MKIIIFILLLLISFSAFSQDAFLSNYPHNILFYNPAHAGEDSMHEFSLSGRSQWETYHTLALTYEQPFNKIHSGIGGILIYQNDGSLPVEEYHAAVCYDYNARFTENMNLRIGAQVGFDYQLIHYNNLFFGNPYGTSGYDSTWTGTISNSKNVRMDFTPAFYFTWNNLFIGVSAHHLPTINLNSSNGNDIYPRFNGIAGCNFQFGKHIINTPSALVMKQGPENYYQISDDINLDDKFFIGAGFRGLESLNALVARAGFRIMNKIQIMFCYNYEVTEPALQTHEWNAYEANMKFFFE